MGSAQSRMDGGEASAPGCTSLFPKLPDFLLVVKALWCELVDRAGEAPEGLLEAALDALGPKLKQNFTTRKHGTIGWLTDTGTMRVIDKAHGGAPAPAPGVSRESTLAAALGQTVLFGQDFVDFFADGFRADAMSASQFKKRFRLAFPNRKAVVTGPRLGMLSDV